MKYQVGNIWFSTKLDLTRYFSDMLNRYGVGECISGDDEIALRWALERHPDYDEKCGAGVIDFTVINSIFGARCFAVRRSDGTTVDFSFRTALNGHPSACSQLFKAMRHEISDDIQNAKVRYFSEHADESGCVPCAVAGKPINIYQAEADHSSPYSFHVLATMFVTARKLVIDDSLVETCSDGFTLRLRDRALAQDWVEFHHTLAHIRLIHKSENARCAGEARPRAAHRQLVLKRDPL